MSSVTFSTLYIIEHLRAFFWSKGTNYCQIVSYIIYGQSLEVYFSICCKFHVGFMWYCLKCYSSLRRLLHIPEYICVSKFLTDANVDSVLFWFIRWCFLLISHQVYRGRKTINSTQLIAIRSLYHNSAFPLHWCFFSAFPFSVSSFCFISPIYLYSPFNPWSSN